MKSSGRIFIILRETIALPGLGLLSRPVPMATCCVRGHAGSCMCSFDQCPNALVQRVMWQWVCITHLMGAAFAKALLVFP